MIKLMQIRFNYAPIIVALLLLITLTVEGQETSLMNRFPTFRITQSNGPSPGYYFLAIKGTNNDTIPHFLAILDIYGTPIYFKIMDDVCTQLQVNPNGSLSYTYGKPRKVFMMNDNLEITDAFTTQGYNIDPHDYAIDRFGNIALMGKSNRTVNMSSVVSGGDSAATVTDLILQEFDKNHQLLYTWNSKDHFEITDANEASPFIDFTANKIDYVHANSLWIDSDTSLLISCRHMDEITKIDRRSGNIIWRLGGKHNMFSFINDSLGFSHQHSISLSQDGRLLLFDNGNLHDTTFSSGPVYLLDELNFTATLEHRVRRNPDVFTNHGGSAWLLPTKDVLLGWGGFTPSATEFHTDGSVALELDFSDQCFSPKIYKFNWQPRTFVTSTDSVDFGMWTGPDPLDRLVSLHNNTDTTLLITSFSTHTNFFSIKDSLPRAIDPFGDIQITLSYNPSNATTGFFKDRITINSDDTIQRVSRQIFLTGRKVDLVSPTALIQPDSANVPLHPTIRISFSESIRKTGGDELDFQKVDALFIFRKNDANGEDVPFNATINTDKNLVTIISDSLLEEGQTYYISFLPQLEDYSGNQVISSSALFSTWSSVGINDLRNLEDIKIYPNPAHNRITLESQFPDKKEIRVYNISGALVMLQPWEAKRTIQVDLKNILPGFYFIEVKIFKGSLLVRKKIIILK